MVVSEDLDELAYELSLAYWIDDEKSTGLDGDIFRWSSNAVFDSAWLAAHDAQVRTEALREARPRGLGLFVGRFSLSVSRCHGQKSLVIYRNDTGDRMVCLPGLAVSIKWDRY